MFNAKTIAAPKINKFANAIRHCTKLKVTPAFRSASGPRFEIRKPEGKHLERDVLVVDVDRDGKTMRVSGITIEHGGELTRSGSYVAKSFPQFAAILRNKFGVEVNA
jgi:hypothetical protein